MPTRYEYNDHLKVVHAAPGRKDNNLYGITTGKRTKDGFPERIDWQKDYVGPPFVVCGHQIYDEPYLCEWSAGIDTGCYETGTLTAYLWPEGEIIDNKGTRKSHARNNSQD